MTLFQPTLGYELLSKVSSGSFGHVFKCKLNDQTYACKRLNPAFFCNADFKCLHEIACLSLLSKISAENLPNMKSFNIKIEDDCYKSWLYMDLYNRDLNDYGFDIGLNARIEQFDHIYDQLIKAVSTLHSLGIVHCDIKNQNILVKLGSKLPNIYLVDFSISSSMPTNEGYTYGYRAPYLDYEISDKKRKCVESLVASYESDIYALGMTFVSFINQVVYYPESYTYPGINISNEIKRNEIILHGFPEKLKLIQKMLNSDLDLPNYRSDIKFDLSKFRTDPSNIVKYDIETIVDTLKLDCSQEDIDHAVDISTRYLSVQNTSDTNKKDVFMGSLYIIATWGNTTMITQIYKCYQNTYNDFMKKVLDIVIKLDGLVYIPLIKQSIKQIKIEKSI